VRSWSATITSFFSEKKRKKGKRKRKWKRKHTKVAAVPQVLPYPTKRKKERGGRKGRRSAGNSGSSACSPRAAEKREELPLFDKDPVHKKKKEEKRGENEVDRSFSEAFWCSACICLSMRRKKKKERQRAQAPATRRLLHF